MGLIRGPGGTFVVTGRIRGPGPSEAQSVVLMRILVHKQLVAGIIMVRARF